MDERPPARTKPDTSGGFRPTFTLTADHVRTSFTLARRDGAFARLEVHPVWLNALRRDAYVLNAHASTSIEGNELDLSQAKALAERTESGARTARNADEHEIVQHLDYFRSLEGSPDQPPGPLRRGEIVDVHARLLNNVLPEETLGRLRGLSHPKFVYFGRNEGTPPLRVDAELDALAAWYDGEGQLLPPPVRVAIWFHEFESIHPFIDGNGRVGRALTHRLLVTEGLPFSLVAPLDAPFNQNRDAYYRALDDGRNDLAIWVDYFLSCLQRAYDAAWAIVQRLSVVAEGFRGAQKAVLHQIVRSAPSEIRVASLVRALEEYRPITVSVALKGLADEHRLLVHNGKRGRASAYIPTERLYALARDAPLL